MTETKSRMAVLSGFTLALVLALFSNASCGDGPQTLDKPATKSPRKTFKLPGLAVNFQERCVDLEGSICLDRGILELVACTKGSKEHESIVAVEARPMHIHAALLLLGANNGNPAMRKPLNQEKTRWVNVPPRGDPIKVYLVFQNSDGKMIERPIRDFITRSKERTDEFAADRDHAKEDAADKDIKFSDTFLFHA